MAWHDGLDKDSPQYRIASETRNPVRVLAGPGTGKTFSLKRRVIRVLEAGQDPKRVLVVTFTRVAAEDLYREMRALSVEGCERVKACTLHSLCFGMLSRNSVFDFTQRTPRVLNEFEVEPLLYDLAEDSRFGDKRERRKRIRACEAAWARLQADIPGVARDDLDLDFEKRLLDWNLFHRSMLLGELVPILLRYLQRNPAAQEHKEFEVVLVDEYQDLNKAEQAIVERLASVSSLTVIGDDDQSIYSFKHAHPEGIREFGTRAAADHGLDDCYRCPTTVVSMANHLIKHNSLREDPPRSLLPLQSKGSGDVEIAQYHRLEDEVQGVTSEIGDKIDSGEVAPGEVLVLTPNRFIGVRLRNELNSRGIPVMSSFQEQELASATAQERMSLLRLTVNSYDRPALRWVLGRKSAKFLCGQYRKLRRHCESSGTEPWDVLSGLHQGALTEPKGVHHLVRRFDELVALVTPLRSAALEDFVDLWLPESIDDVHDLRALARTLIEAEEAADPAELLGQLVEAITQPEVPVEVEEVRVMSLHKSKGLSAPMVVIAGCNDGVVPREPDEKASRDEVRRHLEEQRRLFYVAITRVKADPSRGRPGILRLSGSIEMPMADALKMGTSIVSSRYGRASVRSSQFLSELGPDAPEAVHK